MLSKTLHVIAGLLGHAIKSFVVALVVLEVCWGLVLAGLCFWLASHDSWVQGIIAVVLALLLVTIASVILAGYYAAICVVRKAVVTAGIGKAVFDNLFEHVLGVTGDDTDQQPTKARVPVKVTAGELKSKFNTAARHLLAQEASATNLPAVLFWLARRIEKLAIWATVKVIVKSCSNQGDAVNLYDVRDKLAGVIDDHVVSFVKQYFFRMAMVFIAAASALAILVALVFRLLPF